MESNNLKLWGQVSKTNPAHTKPAKKGAYEFTSIAPMSQIKKATEMFGLQGSGWGVKPGSENFSETTIGDTVLLNYDAILYYNFEGTKGEIPIHATEKLAYMTRGQNAYLKIDDEARKKVVTNAKTKGLSDLGFNADIFTGEWENELYRMERQAEEELQKSEDREKLLKEKFDEIKTEVMQSCETIAKLPTEATINNYVAKVKQSAAKKLAPYNFNPGSFDKKIDAIASERLNQINNKDK